ncbi:MAG TPA: DUF4872 domain-containing protein [Deltaproteobacteria bacterium]|nr:DUF4872 domain-containing protein [Deltaproteobacteria bacterium]
MKTLIEDYESFPGEHCGSAAMRGLLKYYCGLELPEPAIFGLGAGAATVYLSGPSVDPGAVVFGRTASMEQDLALNLQIDYRERPEPDDDEAWRIAREEVLAGRPTMLTGDILYLDYREYKVHFPAHRFVLLGFDDETEKAYIADRIRPEPELCSYAALIKSRNPPEGMSTHNLWGRFHDTAVGRDLAEAARLAISKCAKSMLAEAPAAEETSEGIEAMASEGTRVATGIAGARVLAEEIESWSTREDAVSLASFNASCLEKFGNGGGNFRRLYSGFLSWARDLDPRLVPESAPALALEAADAWTAVSNALFAASKDVANGKHWSDAAQHASRMVDLEDRLFRSLADNAA